LLKLLNFLLLIALIVGCAGNKPKPEWTASQYFRYAKEMYDDEDYFDASNEFTVVALRYAGSTVADSAQFYLGETHFMMKEYLVAASEYEKLINNMSHSPLASNAQYKLAESYFYLSPRPALDQKYTESAIREFQLFVEEFPTHELKADAEAKIATLRDRLAEKMWSNADIYRKMRKYKAAIVYFEQVLEKYYDTSWADDALLGKIETYVENKDYDQAGKEIAKFNEQFPQSELKKDVAKLASDVEESKPTATGKGND
jgi:outer membrane protein assembly factor BamD